MSEFQSKNRNSFWCSPLILFILLCVVLVFIYNMVSVIDKSRDTAKKTELVLDEVESLKGREEVIQSEIDRLETSLGREEAIREKYQLVKEGEKVVVIVDEDQASNDGLGEDLGGFRSFWQKIFR
jgi:cell division protein FtsB